MFKVWGYVRVETVRRRWIWEILGRKDENVHFLFVGQDIDGSLLWLIIAKSWLISLYNKQVSCASLIIQNHVLAHSSRDLALSSSSWYTLFKPHLISSLDKYVWLKNKPVIEWDKGTVDYTDENLVKYVGVFLHFFFWYWGLNLEARNYILNPFYFFFWNGVSPGCWGSH